MPDSYTRKQWGAWLQEDGPNTQPVFLGCHDFDDISEPLGKTTLIRCFKPDGSGWNIIGNTQDPPDPVTVKVTTVIYETADYLEAVRCPATLFLTGVKCGRKDLFTNWGRAFALNLATVTNKTLSGLASREEDGTSEQSFEFESRPPVHRLYGMTIVRQSTTETEGLNDVVFCNAAQCASECGAAKDLCEIGAAVGDAAAGSPTNTADVLRTTNSGGTWAATATDPFAGGEDIISIVCFDISKTVTRYLVARESVLATPMEVAYSDDNGATWTAVTVGAVNAQGANRGGALFALDMHHIWLVVDGGYVYFSDDGGETWDTQDAGVATAQDLNAVWAADAENVMAVGDTDAVIVTSDGGNTWSAATATGGGNNLYCVGYNPYGIWWAGDSGAELYYSNDNATTWTQRTGWTGSGTGDIADIQFANELCAFMIHNTAAPVGTILRTIDGGYTWDAMTTPSNDGLNALWVCDCNLFYAVGEPSGGTAVILKGLGL